MKNINISYVVKTTAYIWVGILSKKYNLSVYTYIL